MSGGIECTKPGGRYSFDQENAMGGKRAGKLLLVEDEHLLRGLIAQFLRAEGFEVVEAADGSQGVGFFERMRPYEVVLLDLNLPLLPGVEVCRRIKCEEPTQSVIICSATILESHIAKLREMQVDQFLTKPYHPQDLLNRIDAEMSQALKPDSPGAVPQSGGPIWRAARSHSVLSPTHTLVKSPILD
jgi:two-component system response regulator RegX3